MDESEFDKLVTYTLRVELVDKKILLYRINTDNKQHLIAQLRERSYGNENTFFLKFLWFETALKRNVIINMDSIARITFCFDSDDGHILTADKYIDNFNVLNEQPDLEEKGEEIEDNVTKVIALEEEEDEESIPDGIIYHKGLCPENNHYYTNPMLYSKIDIGELFELGKELEEKLPIRQFINLIDNDGEENFIPMSQIIVMEIASHAIDSEVVEEEEEEA